MKVAIVTGGSNGIGKSTALELGKRGIGVILTYHSNEGSADEVVREIEGNVARGASGEGAASGEERASEEGVAGGVRAVALKLDLSKKESFAEFALAVKQNLNDIWKKSTFEYLVNNGGTGGGMMFSEISEEYFDNILNTNFKGPFFLTQSLIGLMEDGGRIVNTSSNSSRMAPLGYSIYGPSKAALTSWTRYLAKELAPRQICVNAVSPGPVLTNFGDGAFDKHPEYIGPLAEQTAFGRIGSPQDLSSVIVNLLSDDFGWVTAQDIEVSGGFLL